ALRWSPSCSTMLKTLKSRATAPTIRTIEPTPGVTMASCQRMAKTVAANDHRARRYLSDIDGFTTDREVAVHRGADREPLPRLGRPVVLPPQLQRLLDLGSQVVCPPYRDEPAVLAVGQDLARSVGTIGRHDGGAQRQRLDQDR